MPEADVFEQITAGQEPRLWCEVPQCALTVEHAAICRNCRRVEYVCTGHLGKAMYRYAQEEANGMAVGIPVHWRMGCCGVIRASFPESFDMVRL